MVTIELKITLGGAPGRLSSGVARWSAMARTWSSRIEARRVLGNMDDHMLRDIGLTHREAHLESRKPFWRE